jgi:hypothetical protein
MAFLAGLLVSISRVVENESGDPTAMASSFGGEKQAAKHPAMDCICGARYHPRSFPASYREKDELLCEVYIGIRRQSGGVGRSLF